MNWWYISKCLPLPPRKPSNIIFGNIICVLAKNALIYQFEELFLLLGRGLKIVVLRVGNQSNLLAQWKKRMILWFRSSLFCIRPLLCGGHNSYLISYCNLNYLNWQFCCDCWDNNSIVLDNEFTGDIFKRTLTLTIFMVIWNGAFKNSFDLWLRRLNGSLGD